MVAGRDKGIVSTAELRECGLSRDAISHRARNGRLHRMHRGVYAVGYTALTPEAVWMAAVKACGETALLTHYAGSAHWGFVEWDERRPEVTVRTPSLPRHPGIRVHQSRTIERRDWMIRDGIPVTSPARTLLDLAGIVSFKTLRRAVREAMGQKRVAIPQLVDVLARSGPRRGSRNLARIVADGYTPTESVLSDIVLDLILAGGFERPDVSVPLFVDGRRFVPDFRWPEQRLIVEADGGQWHAHKIAQEDDAERQAILEANGERFIRVTWNEAVTKHQQTWARFATAGAPSKQRLAT